MLAVSFLQWWYTRGWLIYFQGFRDRLRNLIDFFSIGLLLKTLFQPFRQISTNESSENTSFMILFLDHLISRIVGFFIRFGIIVFGVISLVLVLALGIVFAVLWPCIPALPVIGIIVSSMGIVF